MNLKCNFRIDVSPLITLLILIVLTDRLLKFIIFKKIAIGASLPIIEGFLHITPTYNKGAAFGLFKGYNLYLLIGISFLTIVFIIYTVLVKKPKSRILTCGLFLVLAGAIGNLTDRIAYGHVLDFIDLKVWPVFNIADSSITIGAALILWHLLCTQYYSQ